MLVNEGCYIMIFMLYINKDISLLINNLLENIILKLSSFENFHLIEESE